MLKLFHSCMSAVCPHFSTGCLHFSALLWTVCICPHLLSAVVCSVHKINSCQIINGKQLQLNPLNIHTHRIRGATLSIDCSRGTRSLAWSGSWCCPHSLFISVYIFADSLHVSTLCLHVSTLCPHVK